MLNANNRETQFGPYIQKIYKFNIYGTKLSNFSGFHPSLFHDF